MITIVFEVLDEVLTLYYWAIIIAAVMSTLVSFGVLDTRNRLVWTIGDFFARITDPALRPIRKLLPNFGGLDLSPIVLILIIYVIQALLHRIYIAIVSGDLHGLLM